MTSKTGKQIIKMHILPNISRSKIILRKIFFFSKFMQKMRQGGQFQTSFCFFLKVLYMVKASGQHLSFNIFW